MKHNDLVKLCSLRNGGISLAFRNIFIKNNVHCEADVYAHLINHGNHKNWVPSMLLHTLWLISLTMKQKIIELKNVIFSFSPILNFEKITRFSPWKSGKLTQRACRLGWAQWNQSMFELKFDDTVNSWFKKVHFSFLKSRVVWFKKDSKNLLSKKMPSVGEFATWDLS